MGIKAAGGKGMWMGYSEASGRSDLTISACWAKPGLERPTHSLCLDSDALLIAPTSTQGDERFPGFPEEIRHHLL